MSNLLIVNFGTMYETVRFKKFALKSKFVTRDILESSLSSPPINPPIKRKGRIQNLESSLPSFPFERKGRIQNPKGNYKVFTFDDLPAKEFRENKEIFKTWYESAIKQAPPHCIYLTGHHGNKTMFGDGDIELSMESEKELKFSETKTDEYVCIDVDDLQKNCMVVIGMGCTFASSGNYDHYKGIFKNQSEMSIFLGFDKGKKIAIPRRNMLSIGEPFFEYLSKYVERCKESKDKHKRGLTVRGQTGTSVRASCQSQHQASLSNLIEFFYEKHPIEIINAWAYANHKAECYWSSRTKKHIYIDLACATNKDGKYYNNFKCKEDKNAFMGVAITLE